MSINMQNSLSGQAGKPAVGQVWECSRFLGASCFDKQWWLDCQAELRALSGSVQNAFPKLKRPNHIGGSTLIASWSRAFRSKWSLLLRTKLLQSLKKFQTITICLLYSSPEWKSLSSLSKLSSPKIWLSCKFHPLYHHSILVHWPWYYLGSVGALLSSQKTPVKVWTGIWPWTNSHDT